MRFIQILVGTAALGLTDAQILTKGNTQLPACALSCPLLNQAVAACSGQTDVTLATWSCFCQSAYLKPLPQSAVGICDSACTNANENAQVSTWYVKECGQDYGQSEHVNAAVSSGNAAASGTQTTSASSPKATAKSGTQSSTNSGGSSASATGTEKGSYWSNHGRWIIFLLVFILCLGLFTVFLLWLKRRADRRRDAMPYGYNTGITERTVPTAASTSFVHDSANTGKAPFAQSGSRVASQTNVAHGRGLRDAEKGVDGTPLPPPRRVHVRERDASPLSEKSKS